MKSLRSLVLNWLTETVAYGQIQWFVKNNNSERRGSANHTHNHGSHVNLHALNFELDPHFYDTSVRPVFLFLWLTHILECLVAYTLEKFIWKFSRRKWVWMKKKIYLDFSEEFSKILYNCEWVDTHTHSSTFMLMSLFSIPRAEHYYEWCSEMCTPNLSWWLLARWQFTQWQLLCTLFLEFQMQCVVMSGMSF